MTYVSEPIDGWVIAMNDEVGKRAAPGAMFRFGRLPLSGSNRPVVETCQPGFSAGTQYFMPFESEAQVREFLLDLGFTERARVTDQATPRWTPAGE
ncbi:hypothetical protein [Burkholderia sp. Ac-20349]|uniref:hypothetical protein n=1 Tax=Burkholderia sp. Ac-20349 TaxID=2703893 RepID=UPI00197B2175|nr:hypothetical protein [Burkholderia sp. Ac-20349]MBN3839259.1 hypothetical protein [Burkholderia sp. Ac-20349]